MPGNPWAIPSRTQIPDLHRNLSITIVAPMKEPTHPRPLCRPTLTGSLDWSNNSSGMVPMAFGSWKHNYFMEICCGWLTNNIKP